MKIAQFEFNLFGVNTYIVWDETEKQAAIIDPGMQTDAEAMQLDEFINAHSLKVVHLINTHLHIDHTLGNDHMIKQYGLKTEAHHDDSVLGLARAEQARMFHLRIPQPSPLNIDKSLHQGDEIAIGAETLKVIEVPGHSQGSIALYSAKDKFVITGDALFNCSIGRTDLPGGNHIQLINAIRQQLLTLPDDTVVYPGHGPATTIGAEKYQNPYL
ncbi:MAG: MBL fold metallo-hydrolase [Paramuribaculum sp.]|nr:MBL fold metallo-hydrolase [Paramuribaculum sp.]